MGLTFMGKGLGSGVKLDDFIDEDVRTIRGKSSLRVFSS
jgi:hypothetical protein